MLFCERGNLKAPGEHEAGGTIPASPITEGTHTAMTSTTLIQALRDTYRDRWANTRSAATTLSQAEWAVKDVAKHVTLTLGDPRWELLDGDHIPATVLRVDEVTDIAIRKATQHWYALGLSPATILKRLNCLSAMGVSVEGHRRKAPKPLKWWLRPEVEDDVCRWLEEDGHGDLQRFACFIRWTTKTGLRIEESLALRWSDFSADFTEVTVPGTKNEAAQATLAISPKARIVLLFGAPREIAAGPWPWDYREVHGMWEIVRRRFGFTDPTATLKALRRSAARYLHIELGMPLDMVRQYLRHSDVQTTMGYLRLTGGYGVEEQRRYLK